MVRNEDYWKGQAFNIAYQIMEKQYGMPGAKEVDHWIKELFLTGRSLYEAGIRLGLMSWGNNREERIWAGQSMNIAFKALINSPIERTMNEAFIKELINLARRIYKEGIRQKYPNW